MKDIPSEVLSRMDEFPVHGHWHDLADLVWDNAVRATGGDVDAASALSATWATIYARDVFGVDVERDPIESEGE